MFVEIFLPAAILFNAIGYGKLLATPTTPSTKYANIIAGMMLAASIIGWIALMICGGAA